MTPEDAARFWSKVQKSDDPNGCWLWTGGTHPSGYGRTVINGRPKYTHRVSLELHLGRQLEEGMIVLHAPHAQCGNRLCVAPHHLREGTHTDNRADSLQDGTLQRGEIHYSSKVDDAMALAIYNDPRRICDMLSSGDYPLSRQAITDIKKGRTWKHITGAQ
jgi:hypothetical protein